MLRDRGLAIQRARLVLDARKSAPCPGGALRRVRGPTKHAQKSKGGASYKLEPKSHGQRLKWLCSPPFSDVRQCCSLA